MRANADRIWCAEEDPNPARKTHERVLNVPADFSTAIR